MAPVFTLLAMHPLAPALHYLLRQAWYSVCKTTLRYRRLAKVAIIKVKHYVPIDSLQSMGHFIELSFFVSYSNRTFHEIRIIESGFFFSMLRIKPWHRPCRVPCGWFWRVILENWIPYSRLVVLRVARYVFGTQIRSCKGLLRPRLIP